MSGLTRSLMNSFNNKYCPGKDICGYFTYRWVPAHVLGGLKTFPLNTNIVQLQQECIIPDTIKRHSENQGSMHRRYHFWCLCICKWSSVKQIYDPFPWHMLATLKVFNVFSYSMIKYWQKKKKFPSKLFMGDNPAQVLSSKTKQNNTSKKQSITTNK